MTNLCPDLYKKPSKTTCATNWPVGPTWKNRSRKVPVWGVWSEKTGDGKGVECAGRQAARVRGWVGIYIYIPK
jgi:hypothetical protein